MFTSKVYPLLLLLTLTVLYSQAQQSKWATGVNSLEAVSSEALKKKMLHIKSVTDRYVLSGISKSVQQKYGFVMFGKNYGCAPYGAIDLSNYEQDDILTEVIASYQFIDSTIGLYINEIRICFNNEVVEKVYASRSVDRLYGEALEMIYKKGYYQKILQQARQQKLHNFYTQIQVNDTDETFHLVLKDRRLPHKLFLL